MTWDSPALRLHEILSALKAQHNPNDGRPLRVYLGDLFGIDSSDTSAVLASVTRIMALPDVVVSLLDQAPDDGVREQQRLWIEPVRGAMSVVHLIDHALTNFTAHYNEMHLLSLSMAAGRLGHGRSLATVNDENLDRARHLVSDLVAAIESADDLSEAERRLLVRHAAALQSALALVRVSGVDGVMDALIDGYAALRMVEPEPESRREESSVGRFLIMLTYVAAAVSIPAECIQLAVGVQQLLQIAPG